MKNYTEQKYKMQQFQRFCLVTVHIRKSALIYGFHMTGHGHSHGCALAHLLGSQDDPPGSQTQPIRLVSGLRQSHR